MDAVVSGHAGVALLLDGKKLSSIHFGEDGEALPRRASDISLLFAEAGDLRLLKNVKLAQVREQLDLESARVDALHLALILLDADLSDETRRTAAEELEEELADQGIASWLEGVLYAHPLPASADLIGAYSACVGSTELTRALLLRLESLQAVIREVHVAWQAISLERFGTDKDRQYARSVAVRAGLFRDMVADRAAGKQAEDFLFEALKIPALRELRDSRHVLLDWVAAFRKPKEVRDLRGPEVPESAAEWDEDGSIRPRVNRQSVLSQVEWRKRGIGEIMRQRDLEQVRQDVEALISFQLEHGEPVHACKSLCDLAMKAKNLGLFRLQLELTARSTRLKDDDAWSWTQHGDALLCNGRFNEALEAYDSAILFGERLVARAGRAEVLKAQNRLPESLEAYESVIRDFPENVVARNGRAEVLKAQNRLPESLEAYESVIRDFPSDVVARAGRAEVLKAQNRLPESLEAYESVIRDFPENVVARAGRAEVLKAQNRLPESLEAYESVIRDFPENVVARNGRAEVLKAQNRLPESLEAYESVIRDFPSDAVARAGRAEVLKAQNRLPESLEAYESVIQDFPSDVVARAGRADVLKAQNRLPESLEAYESVIRDFPSDVVARNGRAEVLKAQNRLPESLEAYESVIRDFPADVVARTGRAEVLKAQNRLPESLEAYESVIRDFPSDVVARNGRAEVLKAQNRLPESLEAYESVIRDFPSDVVARTGRAEVLKAQNRLPESLEAYESVIRDFPSDVVARNGRACVLAALNRPLEALTFLPASAPVTEQDWIGYHIRGMVLLRMGRLDEAVEIFQDGMLNCPRPVSRDYFRTAFAVSCLQRQAYSRAADALAEVASPQLERTATLLRFHAFAGAGDLARAAEEDRALTPVVSLAKFKEIREELRRRFLNRETPRHSEEWLIESEIDLLLRAA